MTQVMTTCDGKTNSFGFCDKCSNPVQGTSVYCGRLIPVQPVKQQTPLQKLIEWIEADKHRNIPDNVIIAKAKSLLPEEKQMVIDAHTTGANMEYNYIAYGYFTKTSEQYFNETYK